IRAICQFYNDKSVFITGATGFVGKCLGAKLLQFCPNIGKIYILVRPRPDSQAGILSKYSDMVNSTVFENIRKNSPTLLEEVCCLPGEMSLPCCGFDATTLELIKDVEVVIHCASAIRFNMAV
ncbi:unnamed protein product, partial [Allacma fusca]